MFVILTYDVSEKRVNKARKAIKKYLIWTQNSVFEGNITQAKLDKCLSDLNKCLDKHEDSLYIYKVDNNKNIKKDVFGVNKNIDDLII